MNTCADMLATALSRSAAPNHNARRAAALRRAPEPSPFPVSAITRHIEEWNRRAAEMEPIEGF